MKKFGVVNEENRVPLSKFTLKSSSTQEEDTEVDVEVTKSDEEVAALQEMLAKMDAPRQTPRDAWSEEIELEGMDSTSAAKILDAVITNGMYEETYKLGTLIIKVRTRSTSDADRVIEAIQDFKPETNGSLSHLIARMNLAASISQFGEKQFNFTPATDGNRDQLEEEFNGRYNFITSVPAQLFFSLTQVLERFDRRVQLACDPRSIENF